MNKYLYYHNVREWPLLQPVLCCVLIYGGDCNNTVALHDDVQNINNNKNNSNSKIMRHYLESAKLEKIKLFFNTEVGKKKERKKKKKRKTCKRRKRRKQKMRIFH